MAAACLSGAPARGQYRFDSWNEESGLPHNWVKGIWQTRDGYLWLTTGQGAARFDGVRFKVFNRANTPSLKSDRFSLYAVLEDRAGNLWMGTEDGGVVQYRDGVFTSLTTAQGLPSDSVVRVDEDSEGAVWVYTTGGLARWKDGRLTRPAPDLPSADLLPSPPGTGEGGKYFGLWRWGAGGLQRFAHGAWATLPLPPHAGDPARLRFGVMDEDTRGRVWYSLLDRPGERYVVEGGRLTTLRGFGPSQVVHYRDSSGRLWLSDVNGGPAVSEDGRLTSLGGSASADLFRVLEDREGTVWVASLSRGLYRLKRQSVTVHLHPGGPAYNNIQPLTQDRAGNVWVGSGGLARFVEGRFENFYHEGLSRSPAFERNVLISLFEDLDGSFWLGVRDGIVRFRGGRLERDEALSSKVKGWVHSILRDGAGDLWFGSEQGLYRLHDGVLTRYGKQDGLASDDVRVLREDRAGTLWVGTVAGLSRRTRGGFHTLGEADGVQPGRVSALYEDAAGVLWVGTYDGVLYRLAADPGRTRVNRYATEQGLPYDAIHTILEDDHGFFWVGGQRGIYRLARRELEEVAAGRPGPVNVTRLGKEDGLLTPSCNSWGQPAGFKGRDGRLWFPTEEGVAVIDPGNVPLNSTPPPVLIEECLLDRRPAPPGAGLRLSPKQESLEINYTALSSVKPEQIRFRYKLEGLDQEWVEAGTRRTAYYSHLPPGSYTFRVIAANSDGVWNERGATLGVVVVPPFYRTWWFVGLAALAVGAAASALYRRRVAQLERARAAQEEFSRSLINAHESERRRIAAELHDGLGQSLAMIKNSAAFGAHTAEDLASAREHLSNISAQSAQAIGEVREIAYNLRPYLLDRLGLTKAITSMLRKVAESSRLELAADVDDVDGLFAGDEEMSIYRIIQEGLNNVLKHADASRASVSVKRGEGLVTLTISDDGKGLAAAGRGEPGGARRGFGLLGIAERVRMLGGTQSIQSSPRQGTTITITIGYDGTGGKEGGSDGTDSRRDGR